VKLKERVADFEFEGFSDVREGTESRRGF